ncbi:unnamed protein product [Caenorhabditis sp. 36 PRJEB53466]|nr:unnamed protein product [Caenorhabditis sp. 36 PRJEB53466]
MAKPQGGTKASKKVQPPILSHEFIIQNHGDIVSCIVMVFIVGLMFPLTHGIASYFVSPQYNGTYLEVTGPEGAEKEVNGYLNGILDVPTLFFYSICWIVIHAVLQEYGLDKLQKKIHLSKVSTFKFGESFHLLFFAAYSIGHAGYIISERPEDFLDVKSSFRIWSGYPVEHRVMSISYKLFYIFQISYWLHQFPEFYLQKLKREEIRQKTLNTVLYLFFITTGYFLNFTRIGIILLSLEYATQLVFHIARLAHFLNRKAFSAPAFKAYNALFIVGRFATVVLAVMTFWYGLRQTEAPFVDVITGNFNTSPVRLNLLLAIILVQLFQLAQFVSFHLGRFRENNAKKDKKKTTAAAAPKDKKKRNESESDSKKKN